MSVPTLDPTTLVKAIPGALRKLDPRTMWRNPVMFIVEIENGQLFWFVSALLWGLQHLYESEV